MKITRRQLRRLIEASIIKKGDYTIPVEEPLSEPFEDLDYSDTHKRKIKSLAISDDEETQIQSDLFADLGGYEGTDRLGVNTFHDHAVLAELGINELLKDTELYEILREACDYWVYINQEEIVDFDTMNKSADYGEFVKNVILDDPNNEASDATQLKGMVVDIADNRYEAKKDEKYLRIMKLFQTTGLGLVDNLIYDALELNGALYGLYRDWKQYYMSGERDIPEEELTPELKAKFANIKEGRR